MSKQVEASALDRAVEAGCRAIARHAEDVSGSVINDSWLSAVIEPQLRIAVQAADDHLREHYWAEFRERLLGGDCVDAVARDVWQAAHQHPWEMVPEKFKAMRRSSARRHLSVLATTQHKGGSQ